MRDGCEFSSAASINDHPPCSPKTVRWPPMVLHVSLGESCSVGAVETTGGKSILQPAKMGRAGGCVSIAILSSVTTITRQFWTRDASP
jgi:hypothetical protein